MGLNLAPNRSSHDDRSLIALYSPPLKTHSSLKLIFVNRDGSIRRLDYAGNDELREYEGSLKLVAFEASAGHGPEERVFGLTRRARKT